MIRFTLEPRDDGKTIESVTEKDTGNLAGSPSVETMVEVAQALAKGDFTVRCYDDADICVLTATEYGWTPGYQEQGYIPFPPSS